MEVLDGSINAMGSVAYVSQQAWIQNMSLKENIMFGDTSNDLLPSSPSHSKYPASSVSSQKRYDRVIDACSLKSDLEMLSNGDETEIGENGINLSGNIKSNVA